MAETLPDASAGIIRAIVKGGLRSGSTERVIVNENRKSRKYADINEFRFFDSHIILASSTSEFRFWTLPEEKLPCNQ
jgi:hypothetical protein